MERSNLSLFTLILFCSEAAAYNKEDIYTAATNSTEVLTKSELLNEINVESMSDCCLHCSITVSCASLGFDKDNGICYLYTDVGILLNDGPNIAVMSKTRSNYCFNGGSMPTPNQCECVNGTSGRYCQIVEGCNMQKLGPFGNLRNRVFSDEEVHHNGKISKIDICTSLTNGILSSLRFTYGNTTGPPHGRKNNEECVKQIILGKNEFVTKITGYYAASILELTFTTTTGRIIGPHGNHFKGHSIPFEADLGGKHLKYIDGREGSLVDMITFYFC